MKTVLPVDHVLFHWGLLSQNATENDPQHVRWSRTMIGGEHFPRETVEFFSRNLNGRHGMNPDIKKLINKHDRLSHSSWMCMMCDFNRRRPRFISLPRKGSWCKLRCCNCRRKEALFPLGCVFLMQTAAWISLQNNKKGTKNNGRRLPSDLCPSLPASLPFQILIEQKWPTDHFKLLYQWLTDRNGALPPFLAGPVQHKLTHNEGLLNGGLSLTGKPSITRQYTNDHLRQSHSTAMSMSVQHAHSHSNSHAWTRAPTRTRAHKQNSRPRSHTKRT